MKASTRDSAEESPGKKLTTWKEIANHFGRSVATVRRWEKSEGLPVHRHQHPEGATIYAYPAELDAWLKTRGGIAEDKDRQSPIPRVKLRSHFWLTVIGAGVLAAALWLASGERTAHEAFEDVRSAIVAAEAGQEILPAFSPDGTQVAYSWKSPDSDGGFHLYVRSLPEGTARRVTQGGGRDGFAQWSRDGKRLLFSRHIGQRVEVRVVELASGREEPLRELSHPSYHGRFDARWAAWSPDERFLALLAPARKDGPMAVHLVPAGGGEWRQVSFPNDDELGDRDFVFSPDGGELAVVREQQGQESDLYLIRLSDGETKRLTQEPGLIDGIAFSPDGAYLLYGARRKNPLPTLWRLWRDGRMDAVPGLVGEASWPTVVGIGRRVRVAYTRTNLPVNLRRWRAPFRDAPQVILPSPLLHEDGASLSPDGKRVAFRSNRSGPRQIWLANLDGTGLRKLTQMEAVNLDSPRWSPDGRQLVFTAGHDGRRLAYVLDLGTGRVRELPDAGGSRMRASWSADGRWIYFSSKRTGRYEIWKARADGVGPPVQLTRQGGYEAFASLDGRYVLYTKPRPVLGVFRVSVDGGEESLLVEDAREGLWAVAKDAIWFARLHPFGLIMRYGFDNQVAEQVARIPHAQDLRTGFTVSPDGSTVVWCQATAVEDDIAMVEWGR